MRVKILGQGYNIAKGTSVASELMAALNSNKYKKFSCLVAFASKAGVSALAPHIILAKNNIQDFKVVIGVDQKATSKEALEELLTWQVETFIYYSKNRNIFHPKLYIFEGETDTLIIIGSNNLTQMGLVQNIELSLIVEFENSDQDGNDLLKEIYEYFEPIFNGQDRNLKPLTIELIEKLVNSNIVPTEAQRRALIAKENNTNGPSEDQSSENDIGEIFPPTILQRLPVGFSPSRGPRIGTISRVARPLSPEENTLNSDLEVDQVIEINNPEFNSANIVLVAELSGPQRWSQANFDLDNIINFFDTTPAGTHQSILLHYVNLNGEIGSEVISNYVFSGNSNNHRFELHAAAGLTYPDPPLKPIATFIKTADSRFMYNLALPEHTYYQELLTFLNNNYTGRANQNLRVRTDVQNLLTECPNLPFWLF